MKKILGAVLAVLCIYTQVYAAEQPIYYLQTDERWNNELYSSCNNRSQTIGVTGCGPTALAMVLNEFSNNSITPIDAAEFSVKNNHRTKGQGTSWTLFSDAADKYELDFFQTSSSIEVKEWMQENPEGLVICSMKRGLWTSKGHFILLWKIDNQNNVYINDPNSLKKERLFNNFNTLSSQCKQYFCFNKNKKEEIFSYFKTSFDLISDKYKISNRVDFLS